MIWLYALTIVLHDDLILSGGDREQEVHMFNEKGDYPGLFIYEKKRVGLDCDD